MTKELQPFSDALYKEMLGRIKQTDLTVPTPRGGYLYYSRTEEGKQYPIQCRRKGNMEAPEEILLDLNELGKDTQVRRPGRVSWSATTRTCWPTRSTSPASASTPSR